MPQLTRHVWISNEEIDFALLNLFGRLLYRDTLGSDSTNGFSDLAEHTITDGSVTFQVSLTLEPNRLLLFLCSGVVDISSSAENLTVIFAGAGPGTGATSDLANAFSFFGYKDAAGNSHTADGRTGLHLFEAVAGGTYTFALRCQQSGAGAANVKIKSGFKFYICDVGSLI